MNNTFGSIISYLRKEKGISQKQASSDLGISQALLSHYEKGIRECGLDFVVKVADYEPHPKYKKIMESNKHYKAHDAENVCNEGDIVRIVENRPISGSKRWVVAEVVEKAR